MGKSGQGRVSRLASLDNFSSLWGTAVSLVVWYLALEWLGQVNSDPKCEASKGGGWGAVVGLHLKSTNLGELFTIFRNWLVLGGASPHGVKASKHRRQRHD